MDQQPALKPQAVLDCYICLAWEMLEQGLVSADELHSLQTIGTTTNRKGCSTSASYNLEHIQLKHCYISTPTRRQILHYPPTRRLSCSLSMLQGYV